MSQLFIVSITCSDRSGLIAVLTERLFDLGANLGDSAFSTLGHAARFTAVCDMPDGISTDDVKVALTELDETKGGEISVSTFTFKPEQNQTSQVTHLIQVSGGDRPGLVARLSEVFQEYGANIVHMNSTRTGRDSKASYAVEISANIPENTQQSCLSTIANTAGEMGLICRILNS